MLLSRFRPRFTVRRLMVAVAIVAVALGVFLDYEARRHRYTQLRSMHGDRWARVLLEGERFVDPKTFIHPNGRTAINHPDFSEAIRARADHYRRLVGKYEWAADHPWLPVAPDPPEPE